MPRGERPLDADDGVLVRFAADLRALREQAGSPTYRQLSRRAHYSPAALSEAASGRKLPSRAVTLAYVNACGGDVALWEARWRADAAAQATTNGSGDDGGDGQAAPYVGLASFQTTDADRFFGRDRVVADVLARCETRRLVGVFGASGSGKSSLLRAGLTATVERRARARQRHQPVLLFTPGPRPREECAVRLATITSDSVASLVRELSAGPESLHLCVRKALAGWPDTTDLLLVVDQFEELFTLCQDPEERAWLVAALVTATGTETSRTRVVLGVRADFYGHCGRYPELVEALTDAQVLLGSMGPDDLRQAIVQPALDVGCKVETTLVARLVGDAAGQPAALPLVSHALLETWRRRQGITLTLAGYEAAGGIHDAIARTAEDVYTALDGDQQRTAHRIFLRLTALGEGTEDTKRRAHRGEFDTEDPNTRLVVDKLTRARLITVDRNGIEITHEALIRCWPRLRDWLATDRDGRRIHQQFAGAVQVWESLGRDSGVLYRGTLLAVARDWSARGQAELTSREREFLRASIVAQESEHAEARRHTRRLRRLVALLSVLFLLAVSTSVLAVRAQQAATAQRDIALSRQVALEAAALHATNPALAAQLSLAAYRLAPTAQARGGLLSTFATPYATRLVDHTQQVESVAFSPNGHLLATGSDDRTARLWNVTDPHHPVDLATLAGHTQQVESVAFSPNGRLLVTGSDDDTARLWDVTNPRRPVNLAVLTGHTGIVWSVAFSRDGRTLATASRDDTARLWDVTNPHHPVTLAVLTGHTDTVVSVAFSPDGHTLATASDDHTARLWDITDLRHPVSLAILTGHTAHVVTVAFSPDGHTLATGSLDYTARLWDVSDLRHPVALAVLTGHTGNVRAVAFSPDGRALATASEDDTVRLWDITDPRQPVSLAILTGHTDFVVSVTFSPTGDTLATGSDDHTARLWDIPGRVLTGDHAPVYAVAAAPDGHTLAMAGQDATVRLWDVTDPDRPHGLATMPAGNAVWSMAFSRDAHILVTAGEDPNRAAYAGAVLLWDVTDPRRPRALGTLAGHTDHVYGVAISPDSRVVATASEDTAIAHDGAVRLWDVTDPRRPTELATLPRRTDSMRSVAFSPDGHLLATGGDDHLVGIWDVTNPRHPTELATLTGHTDTVRSVVFSPDGHFLATGSLDHTARLWDVTDPRHPVGIATLTDHSNAVRSVVFSPDGHTLATGSNDDTIRVWDITDPRHPSDLATLTGHTDTVRSVAFTADGRTLATASDDHTVRLWDTDPARVATHVCAVADPAIAAAEWDRYFPGLPDNAPCG